MVATPQIQIIHQKISQDQLRLLLSYFGDMVKVVVDVEKDLIAAGGDLHADAEQVLMEHGSSQEHLWGANVYPGLDADNRIEYTALINIRPRQGNPSMEIQDEGVRQKVKAIIETRIIGSDERLV